MFAMPLFSHPRDNRYNFKWHFCTRLITFVGRVKNHMIKIPATTRHEKDPQSFHPRSLIRKMSTFKKWSLKKGRPASKKITIIIKQWLINPCAIYFGLLVMWKWTYCVLFHVWPFFLSKSRRGGGGGGDSSHINMGLVQIYQAQTTWKWWNRYLKIGCSKIGFSKTESVHWKNGFPNSKNEQNSSEVSN